MVDSREKSLSTYITLSVEIVTRKSFKQFRNILIEPFIMKLNQLLYFKTKQFSYSLMKYLYQLHWSSEGTISKSF